MKEIISGVLIIICMSACKTQNECFTIKKQEVNTFQNDTGELFTEKYFVNQTICPNTDTVNIMNGLYEIFNAKGILIQSSLIANNKMSGKTSQFHSNGQLKQINYYRNDTLFGIESIYGENSNLLDTNILINGTGVNKVYHSNNKLAFEYHLIDGKKSGKEVMFDSIGNKLAEGLYKDGLKHGYHRLFHQNNVVVLECNYQSDILVGEYLKYYETGKLKSKILYKYPPFNHQDSIQLRLIELEEDNLLNLLNLFDPDGYLKGIKEGETLNYDINGNLKKE